MTLQINRLLWLLVLLSFCACKDAAVDKDSESDHQRTSQTPAMPALNKRKLDPTLANQGFTFLAVGHLYGNPEVQEESDESPAKTFRDAVQSRAVPLERVDFLISLGDCFRRGTQEEIAKTMAVFNGLNFPVFNAVGNHDLDELGQQEYEAQFGPSYGTFDYGVCRFILLDANRDNWSIEAAQLEFLRAQVEGFSTKKNLKNLFVCSHQLVYSTKEIFSVLMLHTNSPQNLKAPNNFESVVEPILAKAAQGKAVYFLAGDIGVKPHSRALFSHLDRKTNIHYLAAGISNTSDDAYLQVDVTRSGNTKISAHRFSGGPVALADYGIDSWMQHFYGKALPPAVELGLKEFRAKKR